MHVHPLALAAILAGCIDYDVSLDGKDRGTFEDDSGPPVDTSHADTTEETCNGVDDDGDGTVDEGFPDADGDGTADCVDAACPDLVLAAAGAVPIDEACTAIEPEPIVDPWSVRVDWGFTAPDAWYSSSTTPAIGNLDDDNGDGDVDGDDIPDVLIVSGSGLLYALDGATGAMKWERPGIWSGSSPVIADIDADGFPDVAAVTGERHVVALDGAGADKWESSVELFDPFSIQVADLDADGQPEVLVEDAVLDGTTGATRFRLETSTWAYSTAAVGDFDLDGDQEIFRGGVLFDSDGRTIWNSGAAGYYDDYPLVVQADEDDAAEFVVVSERFRVVDDDGATLVETPVFGSGSGPGLPCAADFDGDGVMEVVTPLYQAGPVEMRELDGTVVWENYGPYRSFGAGCSAYDFDDDGAAEVVYATDEALYVYDGRTGAPRITYTGHQSPTLWEFAVVADVDADGHAEIVFVSSGNDIAFDVTALGHAGDGWPAAGPSWSDVEFHVSAVTPDGAVPRQPEPAWLTYKVYRGRPATDALGDRPDLRATITDVCVADCDAGPVEVAVQVSNTGGTDVAAGIPLTVYALDAKGARPVATVSLPEMPAGTAAEGFAVSLAPEDVGQQGFRAVVDDDGTGAGEERECFDDNNSEDWRDAWCP